MGLMWTELGLPITGVAVAAVPGWALYDEAKRANLRPGRWLSTGAGLCAALGMAWYWVMTWLVTLVRVGASPLDLPLVDFLAFSLAEVRIVGGAHSLGGTTALGWYSVQAGAYVGGGLLGSVALKGAWRCKTCDAYRCEWPVRWAALEADADEVLSCAAEADPRTWDRRFVPGPPGPRAGNPYELRAIGCGGCGEGYLTLWHHARRSPTYLRQVPIGKELGSRLLAARPPGQPS